MGFWTPLARRASSRAFGVRQRHTPLPLPDPMNFYPESRKANLQLALLLTLGAVGASGLMIPASWSMMAIPSFGVPPESRLPVVVGTSIGRLVPCVAAAIIGAFLAARSSDATHRLQWTRSGFVAAIAFAVILVSTMLGVGRLLRAQLPTLPSDYVFPPVWQGLALLLGAAYFEELIFRFGLVSLCVFLVTWMMRRTSANQPALWIGLTIAAAAFAGLHLIVLGLLLQVTPSFLVGAFAIAMVGGIGFGLIFVKHGLHFAMLSHALAGPPLYLIVRFGFLER